MSCFQSTRLRSLFSLIRMISLSSLTICVLFSDSVQARNQTIINGWVPEPDGRGTWSILWSCLVTTVLCTWSALHLDVPERTNSTYLVFRKMYWMGVITVWPEAVLAIQVREFLHARAMLKSLAKKNGEKGWSLTHMHFACMDGFRIITTEDRTFPCSDEDLIRLIDKKKIDRPPISEEELSSRGKGDIGVRIIVVLQIIWFVIQTLARANQHLRVTAIETMTNAYVLCSIFIYVFTLKRPQDVTFPVIIELKETAESNLNVEEDKRHKSVAQEATNGIAQENLKPKDTAEGIPLVGKGGRHKSMPNILGQRHGIEGFLPSHSWRDERMLDIVWLTLFLTFALGFGAIHCAAWNAPFPTTKERLAWRIISIVLTVLPYSLVLDRRWFLSLDWTVSILQLCGLVYILGRITIIILAFIALRALPADVFQTVKWSPYLPHFAG